MEFKLIRYDRVSVRHKSVFCIESVERFELILATDVLLILHCAVSREIGILPSGTLSRTLALTKLLSRHVGSRECGQLRSANDGC